MTVKEAKEKVLEFAEGDGVIISGRDYDGMYLFYISPKDTIKNERNFAVTKVVVMKGSGEVIPEVDLDRDDMRALRGPWEPITIT